MISWQENAVQKRVKRDKFFISLRFLNKNIGKNIILTLFVDKYNITIWRNTYEKNRFYIAYILFIILIFF